MSMRYETGEKGLVFFYYGKIMIYTDAFLVFSCLKTEHYCLKTPLWFLNPERAINAAGRILMYACESLIFITYAHSHHNLDGRPDVG